MGVKQEATLRRRAQIAEVAEEMDYRVDLISKRLGIHRTTVTNDMIAMGIGQKDRMERRNAEVRRLWKLGMTQTDIAVKLGITRHMVQHAVASDPDRNGPENRNKYTANRTAPADITRILQTLEPLGPALWEAIDRLLEEDHDLVPDQVTEWRKVFDDVENIGKCYRRLRGYLKEKKLI